MSIPGPPHIEPPRWPGQTSTSGGRSSSRSCSERKIAARALLPVDRQVGPGDVADEQRVAASARPTAPARAPCRSARTPCARGGGRACAARARAARRARAPSRRRTARARSRARPARWTWIVAPVAAASRPWPETWSAWLWVSSTCSMRDAEVARQAQVLVDLQPRVDDRRDAGVLVADQVRGAAEVVVDDLAEDHAPIISLSAQAPITSCHHALRGVVVGQREPPARLRLQLRGRADHQQRARDRVAAVGQDHQRAGHVAARAQVLDDGAGRAAPADATGRRRRRPTAARCRRGPCPRSAARGRDRAADRARCASARAGRAARR